VVILNQADQLTHEAQAGLRRTIERYTATTRVILICNSLSKVIGPLRSRCLGMRVPAPDNSDIRDILRFIGNRENLNPPEAFLDRVINFAGRNLRRAIMAM
jgi:replication factor C subunit 3/5